MKPIEETEFIANIRSRLDQELLPLDADLRARLDGIRAQALQRESIELSIGDTEDDSLIIDGVLNRLDDNLEPSTEVQQRLTRIRRQAVSQLQENGNSPAIWQQIQRFFSFENRFGAGMVATACLTITVSALFYANIDPLESFSAEQELMLVASAYDLELYENLDFYLWLEENGIPE